MLEYIAILVILVVVGYLVSYPLLRSKRLENHVPQSREGLLQEQKEDVYAAIKEMDFDFEMGKISEDDYQKLRNQYKAKVLGIIKEIDTVDHQGEIETQQDEIETMIEREVQQLRAKKKAVQIPDNGKPVGQFNFCPQCGEKVIPNSNFCQNCGITLFAFSQEEEGGDE